ncbi:MAG: hypothetical protein AABW46_00420 [Nanoarchaeota archaeon]
MIGDSVQIWTHDYSLDSLLIGHVKIGNHVKIGGSSIIGPCTIDDYTQVPLGSFVYHRKTRSLPKLNPQ